MDYGVLIVEEVCFLAIQDRLTNKAQVRDRIRFLGVLKLARTWPVESEIGFASWAC